MIVEVLTARIVTGCHKFAVFLCMMDTTSTAEKTHRCGHNLQRPCKDGCLEGLTLVVDLTKNGVTRSSLMPSVPPFCMLKYMIFYRALVSEDILTYFRYGSATVHAWRNTVSIAKSPDSASPSTSSSCTGACFRFTTVTGWKTRHVPLNDKCMLPVRSQ